MLGQVNQSENVVRFLPTRKAVVPEVVAPEEVLSPPASFVPLVYKGGSVIEAPEIVALYWGNFSTSEVASMQAWFAGWVNYIGDFSAPVGQDQVLLQYGVYTTSVGVHYLESSAPTSSTDSGLKTKVA